MKLRIVSQSLIVALSAVAAAGCGATARLSVAEGTGPRPSLPPPKKSVLPTVNVVDATGWPADAAPMATPGTAVAAFARGLDHPRWLTDRTSTRA